MARVRGNSNKNKHKPHLYTVHDRKTSNLYPYGISRDPLKEDGLSKRVRCPIADAKLLVGGACFFAGILVYTDDEMFGNHFVPNVRLEVELFVKWLNVRTSRYLPCPDIRRIIMDQQFPWRRVWGSENGRTTSQHGDRPFLKKAARVQETIYIEGYRRKKDRKPGGNR